MNPEHPATQPAVSESVLEDALRTVIDPEVGMDVMTMGLIYALFVDGDHVTVVYTLTTPHCPLGEVLERDIVDALAAVPGVLRVIAGELGYGARLVGL